MQEAKPAGQDVLSNALRMAFGTFSSRVLGLVRDILFAAMFNKTITDAWGAAFRLPNLFRRLLGEGSLSISFIPIFIESRVQDSSGVRASNLVNGFYTLLLIFLSGLTVTGVLFAEELIRLIITAEAFQLIDGKFELTVLMARIMFVFIFLMSTYAYFMGILNALGEFSLPAMAPVLFNVAMIIANFVPHEWQDPDGVALAWGVVVGGALQMLILVPGLVKRGYWPKLSYQLWSKDISRVLKNMVPGLMGMALLQLTTLINLKFATSLGEGSNSLIYYADRLLELPLSLVSVSLGTALLPVLSELVSKGDREEMCRTSLQYLRLALYVSFPAAIGLFILGVPIVEILFQRGLFTQADTQMTGAIVQIYSGTLVLSTLVRVFVPAYYAVQNTWFPAVASVIGLVFHIFAAPFFMDQFGLPGLPISTLLSALVNFLVLVIGSKKILGMTGFLSLFPFFAQILIPLCVLALIASLYYFLAPEVWMLKLVSLGSVILIGAIAYYLITQMFGLQEAKHFEKTMISKIRRKLRI